MSSEKMAMSNCHGEEMSGEQFLGEQRSGEQLRASKSRVSKLLAYQKDIWNLLFRIYTKYSEIRAFIYVVKHVSRLAIWSNPNVRNRF